MDVPETLLLWLESQVTNLKASLRPTWLGTLMVAAEKINPLWKACSTS